MGKFTVWAKGNQVAAAREAGKRGISLVFHREYSNGDVVASTDADEDKLLNWFNGNPGDEPPFPPGTLLFYRENE